MPRRIQLRRTPGWRKPEGCVIVSRPSRFGNPYKVGAGEVIYTGPASGEAGFYDTQHDLWCDVPLRRGLTAEETVDLYRDDLEGILNRSDDDELDLVEQRDELRTALETLRGKDLGCWCGEGPCHADVLLGIANRRHPWQQ